LSFSIHRPVDNLRPLTRIYKITKVQGVFVIFATRLVYQNLSINSARKPQLARNRIVFSIGSANVYRVILAELNTWEVPWATGSKLSQIIDEYWTYLFCSFLLPSQVYSFILRECWSQ